MFAEEHENTVTASPCFVVRAPIIQPPTIFRQKCFLNISLFKLVLYARIPICGYDILFNYTALGIHLYKTFQPNNLNLTFSRIQNVFSTLK